MPDEVVTTRAPRKLRWLFFTLKALAVMALALVLSFFVAMLSIDWVCGVDPPTLDSDPAILSAPVQEADGVRRIGDSWIARKDGILRMYLTGDPFTLGYSSAVLARDLMQSHERSFMDFINQKVPSRAARWLLLKYLKVRNRDLPSFVSRDRQLEIYGLSRAYPDPFPEIGPLYMRLLNYHAAHDISHAVKDHPLVGCTTFAAWGQHTPNGHLMLGRNFDFDAGRQFDIDKIVMRVKPDTGLGYISVAWPGMTGVVSGINDARIAITINASQSVDLRQVGTPVSLVMREVMQYARTLQEAIDIIERSRVFVNDAYLVADGKLGQAVVVEKTPARMAVRKPREGEEFIISSNHFLTERLKSDPVNLAYMEEGTSVLRHERMEALVRGHAGPLTPEAIARILRDRAVAGCASPGLGNGASINSLIATHSVIMDVTDGIIWVSAGPHQLGPYLPFSLSEFDRAQGAPTLPADPLLADGSYDRYWRARQLLEKGDALLKRKRWDQAVPLIEEAARLNPDFYLPPLMLGKVAFERGSWPRARQFLLQAQDHFPAYGSERSLIRQMLDQIQTTRRGGPGE